MDFSREALIQLRRLLAQIYPDKEDQRRIVSEAGFRIDMINFSNKAVNSWYSILDYIKMQNGLEKFLAFVGQENPDNELLQKFLADPSTILDGQKSIPNWQGPKNKRELEKLTGPKSTLTDIIFLEIGLERARSVARLELFNQLGSGFLIANNLLVTNNHVISSASEAKYAKVQFNYQRQRNHELAVVDVYRLDPDRYFKTSQDEDWTIVALAGDANKTWGQLDLKPAVIALGDRVNIIQHPLGQPKQVAYLANTVVHKDETWLQYLTDTEAGSSGSPVFNVHWDVVALHHAFCDPDGQFDYVRNEGVLVDRILAALFRTG
ncbi:MAG: trypsin-like peptidase domain-containing protein [Deinococcales bacterium]